MDKRGVILTHNFKLNDSGGIQFSESITPDDLRNHLLYFDFIDFPRSIYMQTDLTKSEENKILIDQGFLRQTDIFSIMKPNVTFADFQNMGRDSIIGQLDTVNYYAKQNTKCVISQNNIDPKLIELYLPKSIVQKRQIIEMDMQNCLPIPCPETNIIDILEFKHKREAELIAFRAAMDNLQNDSTTNIENINNLSAFKILEQRIIDIDRTLAERKFNIVRTSKKILLNIPDAFLKEMKSYTENAILGYVMFSSSPTAVAQALAIRGVKAIIKASAKELNAPAELPENIRDFAYVFYVHKELN